MLVKKGFIDYCNSVGISNHKRMLKAATYFISKKAEGFDDIIEYFKKDKKLTGAIAGTLLGMGVPALLGKGEYSLPGGLLGGLGGYMYGEDIYDKGMGLYNNTFKKKEKPPKVEYNSNIPKVNYDSVAKGIDNGYKAIEDYSIKGF